MAAEKQWWVKILNKIRTVRRHLIGWVKNINGTYKKEKKEIMSKLE
jgi:hypothetical protein